MPNNHSRAKSARKPLMDISNGGKYLKSFKKKTISEDEGQVQDRALDRLLLVQSDHSSIVHQIDELVAQAFKLNRISKKGEKEIESFTHVLSEMNSSLKSWVPRFWKALSSPSMEPKKQQGQCLANEKNQQEQCLASEKNQQEQCLASEKNQQGHCLASETVSDARGEIGNIVDSPQQSELGSLVSPSPLVSWRAEFTVEGGRQLFLLTPLPRSKALSSKCRSLTRSVFGTIADMDVAPPTTLGLPSSLTTTGNTNDDLLEGVEIKPKPNMFSDFAFTQMGSTTECRFDSPPRFSKREHLLMTPRLKTSPPKSCVLLEPISESSHRYKDNIHKSTRFPVGTDQSSGSSQNSDSSSTQVSENLALKYPEIFGLQPTLKSGMGRKDVEASLDWFVSPPKTCVLMEPPDEKLPRNAHTYGDSLKADCVLDEKPMSTTQGARRSAKKSCNQGMALLESTPMGESKSTIRTGKFPGENTLKKELWTRFEAASTRTLRFDGSLLEERARKGFLDRLEEEASCDEVNSEPKGLR